MDTDGAIIVDAVDIDSIEIADLSDKKNVRNIREIVLNSSFCLMSREGYRQMWDMLVSVCNVHNVQTLKFVASSDISLEGLEFLLLTYYAHKYEEPQSFKTVRSLILLPGTQLFASEFISLIGASSVKIIFSESIESKDISKTIGSRKGLISVISKTKNYRLRKLTFEHKGIEHDSSDGHRNDTLIDKILQRNEKLFSKRSSATIIVLGITKFRKIPTSLCKDIMQKIALEVWRTPLQDIEAKFCGEK